MMASRNSSPIYVIMILFVMAMCIIAVTVRVGGW
jgi:hypothetical protein